MADTTEIAWTDSTFNPWWGCSKVGPGCDNCYAEALDRRTGGNHWGPGTKPRKMSDGYWKEPPKWDKTASDLHRVFCGSMCDVFDKNAPPGQRERLWDTIKKTPKLSWLLLTKRVRNITDCLPADWREGYPNVWLGATVEDRHHGLPRIDTLREIPARIRFLSCEPLLEDLGPLNLTGIHWVIVGGESGTTPRPMEPSWVEGIIRQCEKQGVPVFFKQWGGPGKDKGGCMVYGGELKQIPAIEQVGQMELFA